MKILGIETSCDETAISIVDTNGEILSNIIFSQVDDHQAYGGVVPEIAARAHMEKITGLIETTLKDAGLSFKDIDAIAATTGPGLIGGLIVGVMAGKTLASVLKKPFYAINHLEGHALTARLSNKIEFPFLLLLVSGGHCQVLAVEDVGKYKLLGSTQDDALGEAFDKIAKMMGLPYPGGPELEKLALKGDAKRFALPRAMKGREGCDFSFSGIKTAVRLLLNELGQISEQDKADIAASFQNCAGDILVDRIGNAIEIYNRDYNGKSLVVAGGVAANRYLFGRLKELTDKNGFNIYAPPLKLCTDNAAMIAWAGAEKIMAGHKPDSLDIEPKARWPIYS